jgi:hypothetical protein
MLEGARVGILFYPAFFFKHYFAGGGNKGQ